MTQSTFPSVQAPFVDGHGRLSMVAVQLLQTLWNRTGGALPNVSPVGGSPNQAFQVANAATNTEAVNLGQANGLYAPLAGNPAQAFLVGNSTAGTNTAVRRSQADALYVAFAGAGGAIQAVTLGASPAPYTATAAGFLALSGGTGVSVTLTRGGVTVPCGSGNVPMRNGDVVTVTYTAVPTANFLPS